MRIVVPAVLAALVALAPVASAQVVRSAPAIIPAQSSATVPAAGGWTRTGVTVRSGGRLELRAQGQWSTGPSLTAAPAFSSADGVTGRRDPRALLSGANVGALIGKIGDKGEPFLVGASYAGAAAADGELFLAFNDDPRAAVDNTGRLSVAVTARPPLQVTRLPSAAVTPPAQPPGADTPTRPPTATPPPTDAPTPLAGTGAAPPSTAPPQQSPPRDPPPSAPPAPEANTATPPATQEPVLPEPESAPVQDVAAPAAPPAAPIEPQPKLPTWLIPALLASAAALVLLLLLRGGRKSGGDSTPPIGAPRVSARVAADGRVGETLSVSWRGRA